jgi:hypothetical protein
MADIKIKEGSLELLYKGKNTQQQIRDDDHNKSDKVTIQFIDRTDNTGNRLPDKGYTFLNGESGLAVAPKTMDLKNWAQGLILLWGFAIFVFWFWASVTTRGVELADVPSGLAAVVAAVVAVTGWQTYLARKYPG